jgi:uncharacterized protein Yka (UPF0111/DUF47 family)
MVKQIRQLSKAYHNRLNKIEGLEYFIEYLRYLRDCSILSAESIEDLDANVKVNTLIAAISEFEVYENTEDEAQSMFHWNNFWEFVKLNIKEWQTSNDSI